MPSNELHIASLVIYAAPRRLTSVAQAVASIPDARVHATSANGKLVVTLEAPTGEAMTQQVASIHRIDGVLSTALVYQCADSLDAMNAEIPDA